MYHNFNRKIFNSCAVDLHGFSENRYFLSAYPLNDIYSTIIQPEESEMTYEEALETISPGKYRHYKGNEYEVIGIAKHSETLEPMVVYRALYGEKGLWVRPAGMWNETIDSQKTKRFTKI